mmetsp:Transcript_18630/g.52063  ORF Transcript_18630/g.52063 Transcript_18630/m.52063 type:complete len:260 (+) Transcript_18630:158-937(+)
MQCKAKQSNAMQCNPTQRNATQRNARTCPRSFVDRCVWHNSTRGGAKKEIKIPSGSQQRFLSPLVPAFDRTHQGGHHLEDPVARQPKRCVVHVNDSECLDDGGIFAADKAALQDLQPPSFPRRYQWLPLGKLDQHVVVLFVVFLPLWVRSFSSWWFRAVHLERLLQQISASNGSVECIVVALFAVVATVSYSVIVEANHEMLERYRALFSRRGAYRLVATLQNVFHGVGSHAALEFVQGKLPIVDYLCVCGPAILYIRS